MLPAPVDIGLPDHFSSWRPGQTDAILKAIDEPQRFIAEVLPTGFGKSIVYMAIAVLTGMKTVILTSTRALQRQLQKDFHTLEVALVQGQRSYLCKALEPGGELYGMYSDGQHRTTFVDHGPCHVGVECSLKQSGCGYFDAVRSSLRRQIVITNYAWWFTLVTNPTITLRPTLLVLDEAHAAPDALADALGASLDPTTVGQVLNEKLHMADKLSPDEWVGWAASRHMRLTEMLAGTSPATREAIIRVRRAKGLAHQLKRIASIDPSLMLVSDQKDASVKFDVVWAAGYAEQWLFRNTPKVLLTSATLTKKTAELIGIMEKDLYIHEAGDGFPVQRRPVYISPAKLPPFGTAIAVEWKMSEQAETALLAHIDHILDGRTDRKGIIHTVSYPRRDFVISRSAHRERMMTHGRNDTLDQIRRFKAAAPGTILVSPSVTTGYDFPYDQCEFQIVIKAPFPVSTNPVTKARTLVDKRYPNHVAIQQIVQSVGRGMRAADDQCETFITDRHAIWLLNKNADMTPRWFKRAIKRLDPGTVPPPPPRLAPIPSHDAAELTE